MVALTHDMRLPTLACSQLLVCCWAGPEHKEMAAREGFTATVLKQPLLPPRLHPQCPRASTVAWAGMGDALQAGSRGSWHSSSLPSSVPSKTVELSTSYN